MLGQRRRYNALLRHFYHTALADVDLYEAVDLLQNVAAVGRMLQGIDPDFVDPAEWFAQNTAKRK